MEWTNDLTVEFLNLYRNEEAIWKCSSPQHKNRNDVHDAWLRVQSNLQGGTISLTELKKKKESLMSTYRKMKGKIKDSMKTGSGSDEIYKPEWPFYNVMATFLDDIYKPRNTKATVKASEVEANEQFATVKASEVIPDVCEEDIIDESNVATNESTLNLKNREEADIPFKTPKTIPKKKKKLDDTQNRMDEAYTYFKELREKPHKDVSSMFCDLLAEKLRNLKENTREIAMLEIDKLIYNLKQLENKQQPTTEYGAQMTQFLHQPLSLYGQQLYTPPTGYHQISQSQPLSRHTLSSTHRFAVSQLPRTQVPLYPQQSPSVQSFQGSPNFQPPPSHAPGYQSPYHSQPSPHSQNYFQSQAPSPQTILYPQQSPSVQLSQGSPNFQPPPSHSSEYQSLYHSQPSPHSQNYIHSQAPSPQTTLYPQQSPSVQSSQGSPNFQPPPSHSLEYQSPYHSQPSPHSQNYIHSQAPSPQTTLYPQQSPSVQSSQGSPNFRPPPSHSSEYQSPYHSQPSPHSQNYIHSQALSPQTTLYPQQSPSVQSSQGSPNFQPPPSHSPSFQCVDSSDNILIHKKR